MNLECVVWVDGNISKQITDYIQLFFFSPSIVETFLKVVYPIVYSFKSYIYIKYYVNRYFLMLLMSVFLFISVLPIAIDFCNPCF